MSFSTAFRDNFRAELVRDVIFNATVEKVGMDFRLKFGDSRSNHSSDIRVAHIVMDDERRRRRTQIIHIRQNAILSFCLKIMIKLETTGKK